MQRGSSKEAALIRAAIEQQSAENLPLVRAAIANSGALAYTSALAQREADMAIESLEAIPDSTYRAALVSLARLAAKRSQ